MSMTREEAIKILQHLEEIMSPGSYQETFKMAISALRGPTREQVEKVLKAEWVRHKKDDDFSSYYTCSKCGAKFGESCGIAFFERDFCPMCGSPVTDSGVDMVMERLEAMKDGKNRGI